MKSFAIVRNIFSAQGPYAGGIMRESTEQKE